MRRAHITSLFCLTLLVACDGPTESVVAPSNSESANSVDLCSAAASYLQACGGTPSAAFTAQCTDDLANALLEMGCGELAEALEEEGLIPPAAQAPSAAPTLAPGYSPNWPGSSLACALGFSFACPVPECVLEEGIDAPAEGDACIEWMRFKGCGACEYYRCREEQSQCGEDGYLLGYVGPYCDRFSRVTEEKASPAAAAWLEQVRACLVTTLENETDETSSCQEIEEIGIASHATCYVQSGFCDLSLSDWFHIVHTIDPGDVPFQQILATGQLCLQSWFD